MERKALLFKQKKNGFVLVAVMLLSTLFLTFTLYSLYMTLENMKTARYLSDKVKVSVMAETGTNIALSKIRKYYHNPVLLSFKPRIVFSTDKNNQETKDDFFLTAADKISAGEKFNINGNFFLNTFEENEKNSNAIIYRFDDNDWADNGTISGNSVKTYGLEVMAYDPVKSLWEGIKGEVEVKRLSLFNYAAFFNDDLEILPADEMGLTGKIHTNKNMYLGGPVKFDSFLTAAGHIYRGRKDNSGSTVDIQVINNSNTFYPMSPVDDSIAELSGFKPSHLEQNVTGSWKVDDNWKEKAFAYWQGRVQDSVHGTEKKATPATSFIERDNEYEKLADLKIITSVQGKEGNKNYKEIITVTLANEEIVYKKTIDYSGSLPGETYHNTLLLKASGVENDPFRTISFKDGRETDGKTANDKVRVTVIDLSRLQKTGFETGMLYASREDAVKDSAPEDNIPDSNRRPYGIMLENGAELEDEFIFVSDNPVYIKGDFNLHKTPSGERLFSAEYNQELRGFGNPFTDTWKPALVISDSLTLLSKVWNEQNYQNAYPKTKAADTEYNLSVITGIVKTSAKDGTYSGGLENLPRLLENWQEKTLVSRGSFIQMWQSRFATGRWQKGKYDYFSPPKRVWGFDNSYDRHKLSERFLNSYPAITEAISLRNLKRISAQQSNIIRDIKGSTVLQQYLKTEGITARW